jgi:hypothetical protein
MLTILFFNKQCCGTVDLLRFPVPIRVPTVLQKCSGSGSYSGSVSGSSFKSGLCSKSCLFNARSSIVSQEVGLKFFYFLASELHFILDPGPNPVPEPDPEPEFITVPVPLRQNVAVPAW